MKIVNRKEKDRVHGQGTVEDPGQGGDLGPGQEIMTQLIASGHDQETETNSVMDLRDPGHLDHRIVLK